ncbi:hypothetical protein ATCC90586_006989 [Pythium insidiosum]|nr:hypothetical protein ATCC90586_006989 [Pythium insidiosum]
MAEEPTPHALLAAPPIVVPHMPDLSPDGAAGSPAVSALGGPPPTVSPMAPAISASSLDEKAKTTKSQTGMNGGRWTEQEHQSFLAGLRLYGREWKKVASKIKTRTSAQIRSHAQKYFAKLARDDEARKQSGLLHHFQHPQQHHAQQHAHLHASDAGRAGYLSDGGSSTTTTTGNNSGDDAADHEHEQTSRPLLAALPSASAAASSAASSAGVPSARPILPIHPHPYPAAQVAQASPSAGTLLATKKRARSLVGGDVGQLKQRKTSATASPSSVDRLPSPEELLERVSPSVRQRLASLIEAEICALQVLSCCAWLTQQSSSPSPSQPQDAALLSSMLAATGPAPPRGAGLPQHLALQHQSSPHHLRSPHLASFSASTAASSAVSSSSSAAAAAFASKSPAAMGFAMRTSSIF